MVKATSARPNGARPAVPAKMTSSILPPRRLLAPCSPITQARASTTLDLPEPLGPTMQVTPGSSRIVVAEAKDLKPFRVRLLTYTSGLGSSDAGGVDRGSLYRRGRGRAWRSRPPRRGGERVWPVGQQRYAAELRSGPAATGGDRPWRSALGDRLVVVDDLGDDEVEELLGEGRVEPCLARQRPQAGHLDHLARGVGRRQA